MFIFNIKASVATKDRTCIEHVLQHNTAFIIKLIFCLTSRLGFIDDASLVFMSYFN